MRQGKSGIAILLVFSRTTTPSPAFKRDCRKARQPLNFTLGGAGDPMFPHLAHFDYSALKFNKFRSPHTVTSAYTPVPGAVASAWPGTTE